MFIQDLWFGTSEEVIFRVENVNRDPWERREKNIVVSRPHQVMRIQRLKYSFDMCSCWYRDHRLCCHIVRRTISGGRERRLIKQCNNTMKSCQDSKRIQKRGWRITKEHPWSSVEKETKSKSMKQSSGENGQLTLWKGKVNEKSPFFHKSILWWK